MSRPRLLQLGLGTLVIGSVGTGLTLLHRENADLSRQLAAREASLQRTAPLRTENAQLVALLTAFTRDTAAVAEQARTQLEQTRIEIADLERRAASLAAERAARAVRDAEALDRNRDPRQGLVRLANFQDQGRASPSAALQTAISMAMKGDTEALAHYCLLRADARQQAEALITRLPEASRTQWTPEKLGALWVTSAVTDLSALQIIGESYDDPQNAVITIRGPKPDQTETLKLRLTREGWAVLLPTSAIATLEKKMGGR